MSPAESHGSLLAIVALLCGLLLAGSALAIQHPREQLPSSALEERAVDIGRTVACVVCQGESIEESRAPLARDIRRLIRIELADGKSDDDVKAALVARYGEQILLAPPFRPGTWLLWLMPLLVLGIGGVMARSMMAHKKPRFRQSGGR